MLLLGFWWYLQFWHPISTSLTSYHGGIKFQADFQLSTCSWRTGLPSSRLWSLLGPWLVQLWFGSLVQIVAVAAVWPVVALAELPDPTTSLHHHLLRQSHHNAKEVRILECLGKDRAKILLDFKVITLTFHLYIN